MFKKIKNLIEINKIIKTKEIHIIIKSKRKNLEMLIDKKLCIYISILLIMYNGIEIN